MEDNLILVIKAQEGNKLAKEELIENNKRLVMYFANKYKGCGLEIEDLIQEGTIGLIIAINKFNPELGFKFSTYASYWIKQSINKALVRNGRSIRLPANIAEQVVKLKRAVNALTLELEREPSKQELGEYLKLPLDKIEELYIHLSEPSSLDAPVGDEEDDSIVSYTAGDDESIEAQYDNTELNEQLNIILSTLSPKEKEVISLRFGFTDGTSHTLESIGAILGLTRERIRQIEDKAMIKLRNPMRTNLIKDYI